MNFIIAQSVKLLLNLLFKFSSHTGVSNEDIYNQLSWGMFYPPNDLEMMWADEDEKD